MITNDETIPAVSFINEAIQAAMDNWKAQGQFNIDRMRETIDNIVEDAICEWQTDNVDAVTDEELDDAEERL